MIEPPNSHIITVNAAEQDQLIDSVTVFQADRAEVKRRVQLQLKEGQNQITIERLPTYLVEDSLRVQGTGTAIIFDVVYHSPDLQPRYGRRQVVSDSSDEEDEVQTEQQNAVEALKKQRSVVENQISFLDRYGYSVVDSQNSTIENVERFLDLYGSRRDALDKRVRELDLEVGRAEKALRTEKKQKQKPGRETKGQRQTKVTVTVMSKEEGNAELLLAYVVSNASWTPIYEIRASVSSSPNSPSTITLHYRASLTQATEEDWPEVALTLSTATPYRGAMIPTLSTWHIGIPSYARGQFWSSTSQVPRGRSRSRSPPTRIIQVGSGSRSRSRSSARIADVTNSAIPSGPQVIRVGSPARDREKEPSPMIVRQVDGVDAGVLSATFTIPGRSNIPSDQGNHKVLIASLDFQVDPEWVCIPRKDESVFLRCKVTNSSEFTLLPGEASVFIGDNFVSKSQIQHVPPSDSFQLSLGIDPALRVTYAPVHTHNSKPTHSQSGFAFPGRQKQPMLATKKYVQQITIRNTRPTAVPAVHILDHVPVSNDSTVKVNVTSPRGLRENSQSTEDSITGKRDETWAHLQKGVRARWAPPNMGGEGAIEWVCAVGAGEEVELKLGWEVSAPKDTLWGNL